MITKSELYEFVEACISTGKYVETGLHLPKKEMLEIDNIVNKYNDVTAKTKIRKVVKNTKSRYV